MTETEWSASTNLGELVYFLQNRITERKWRLFAVGCCRSLLSFLHDQRSRNAIEVVERLADGTASDDDVETAHQLACAALSDAGVDRKRNPPEDVARVIAIPTLDAKSVAHATAMSVVGVVGEVAWKSVMGQGRRNQEKRRGEAWRQEEFLQVSLLRDVIGNPFLPATIIPGWLTWHDGTVVKVAQAIYDERVFDRLPVLADALEDAGCTNADILNHCRQPGPHVRGCWVLDLLLMKE